MDEYVWIWLYQNWLQDQEEMHKTYKDYALFLGAFFNSEMANNIWKSDNPDHASTDKDFEKSTEVLAQQSNIQPKHRRRRKIIKEE